MKTKPIVHLLTGAGGPEQGEDEVSAGGSAMVAESSQPWEAESWLSLTYSSLGEPFRASAFPIYDTGKTPLALPSVLLQEIPFELPAFSRCSVKNT